MVQVEYPKQAIIAVVLVNRTAAIIISGAKIGETESFLPNNHSICSNSEKRTGSVVVLSEISSFKKDAAPGNGAASFSHSTKIEYFHLRYGRLCSPKQHGSNRQVCAKWKNYPSLLLHIAEIPNFSKNFFYSEVPLQVYLLHSRTWNG